VKRLILDIEISPTVAPVWNLFNQNIPIGNIIGDSEVLSWAAKWHGSDECEYSSLRMVGHTPSGKRKMLKEIFDLLEQADVVVGYNSNSFDLKILNKDFLMQGFNKPAPYKTVDLLKVVRNQFRFTSNKLDYISQQLGIGKKAEHPGMQMWLTCMNRAIKGTAEYEKAWDTMEHYNCEDVFLTEDLYDKVLGWIPNHPSFSVFHNDHVCVNCGGSHFQSRGVALTLGCTYKRLQCMNKSCGKWNRVKTADKADKKNQLVGVN